MGEANQRRVSNKRFLEEHLLCCLCGGLRPATTIEHAPPKVLFIDKKLPASSHRVPACKRCNNESGDQDQVAALLVFSTAVHKDDVAKDYRRKLRTAVKKFSPEPYKALINAERYAEPVWKNVNGVYRMVSRGSLPPTLYRDWLNPWAAKLTYALHYLETGANTDAILPPTARVMIY